MIFDVCLWNYRQFFDLLVGCVSVCVDRRCGDWMHIKFKCGVRVDYLKNRSSGNRLTTENGIVSK